LCGPPIAAAPRKLAKSKRPKMPSEKVQNLQDAFLNHVRKQKIQVTIFLVNGVKLQGVITWFDSFSLLLRRDQPIQLFDPESGGSNE
jgi:host factor-I protein